MSGLRSKLRAVAAAATAAIVILAVAAVPATAATATFPKVEDCSPFADFYNTWDKLPHTLYADGTRWVPQGLTYDPKHQWLISSFYDGRDGIDKADKYPSILAVSTLAGEHLKYVEINTADVDRGGHAGGLGVGKGSLYISSTEHGPRVTRIPLDVLAAAEDGSTLPDSASYDVAAASYATVFQGSVYVGDFENDRMYRYGTDRSGDLLLDTPSEFPTPTLVQGLAVTQNRFVFSRSYGRTRLSYLTTVDRRSGAEQSHVLPNMVEGITWAPADTDEHLYLMFESGSAAYGPGDDGGSTTCMTHQLWHGPERLFD